MSEDLMQSTPEEQAFWCDCVRGLPGLEGFSGTGKDKFGENIPWGTGPHSLRAFREAFEIVNPKSVFVIGFNMGYADAVFLELNKECKVYSCDISLKDETIKAAEILTNKYPDRFLYKDRNNTFFSILLRKYDLCFIDGSHHWEDVVEDIKLCLSLEIKYFLYDDILPAFGTVQDAIDKFPQLELVKE